MPPNPAELNRKAMAVHYLGYCISGTPGLPYYTVENSGFEASPERTPRTYSRYNSIDDNKSDQYSLLDDLRQVWHWPGHLRRCAGDSLWRYRAQEGVALVKRLMASGRQV